LTDEVKFSSCTTFGKIAVTVSPETVEYLAEGTETLVSPIVLTPSGMKCHYEIEPQSARTPGTLTFEDGTNFSKPKLPNGSTAADSLQEKERSRRASRDENTGGNLTWIK
jgi:hypothetical protein